MSFRPHRFGRYIIIDPIAVGGMAEIYRARLATAKDAKEGGPDRVIIIKKVIANLSQNSEFTQMFEEEIKITVGLTHPNIIQIYDYGKVDEQYFMAMEYVEGKNLRQFVKRLADMKSMFSIDMSCHIISQICHALSYAHAYKDRLTGKPLGIVHRDISPQNIMISYDGAVKLFDFGIAKAKSASEATRAGVIKGKPSYLSPEQINGEELDGRCDIFALGIVLWELLTAKRLFVADTDMGVLRLIQSAKIEPPSTFNPAVPQALDAIILKSLTRDKNKRYQHAEEFQRDLHKFLYSFNASFNPADLSYYAQELFKTEIREDRERLTKYLSIAPVDDGKEVADAGTGTSKKNLSTKLADGLMSSTDFNREMMDLVVKENTGKTDRPVKLATTLAVKKPESVQVTPPGAGAAKPPLPGGSAPMINTTTSGLKTTPRPAALAGKKADSMVIPPWSKNSVGSAGGSRGGTASALHREMDEQGRSMNKSAPIFLLVLIAGSVFAARQLGLLEGTPLEFLAPAHQASSTKTETNTPPPPPNMDRPVASANNPTVDLHPNQGLIILQATVGNFQVTMNGQPVSAVNGQFVAPLNTNLIIEVKKFGYEPVKFQTKLTGQQPAAFRLEFKPLPTGVLNFVTTPVDANLQFFSNGEKVYEGRSPIRDLAIPPGVYKVKLENSFINYRGEIEITVELGKITQIEKVLK